MSQFKVSLFGRMAGLLLLAFGASTATAKTEIREIQLDSYDPPMSMAIYGTEFGAVEDLSVFIGTDPTALTIINDVVPMLCNLGAGSPPLDSTGMDCVEVLLPQNIPDGDYLVWLETETKFGNDLPACSCDDGKPDKLTFKYTGSACSVAANNQGSKFYCSGDPAGAEPVQVICDTGDCLADPSGETLMISDVVILDGTGGKSADKFGAETNVEIRLGGSVLQDLNFHTSCSVPLAVGDQFGSLLLTEFIPVGGSTACNTGESTVSTSHYDLTIGAVGADGAQGPQGKVGPQGDLGPQGDVGDQGDQGDQGPQGKIGPQGDLGDTGDTGAQGPQGKIGPQGDLGDTGAQGPQGKIGPQGDLGDTGDTGAQGPQGKIGPQGDLGDTGDTGAQGPQGKIGPQGDLGDTGDTGAQGPQGKIGPQGDLGDTGAQGPQGKIGPQGDLGDTGDTGAQGPQGKIGPQGDLGDTGDTCLLYTSDAADE